MNKKKHINPIELFNSKEFGFSQVVVSEPGQMVFISGQVNLDKNRHIVGENDLRIQTKQAFSNLKIAIESVGGRLTDIVMLRIYVVNYQDADAEIIGAELRNCFGTTNPPASTWLGVTALANEKFMIEIEAQAVIGH